MRDFEAKGNPPGWWKISVSLKNLKKARSKAQKALEDDEGWLIVRGRTKVILVNVDELKIEPVKKAKVRK